MIFYIRRYIRVSLLKMRKPFRVQLSADRFALPAKFSDKLLEFVPTLIKLLGTQVIASCAMYYRIHEY